MAQSGISVHRCWTWPWSFFSPTVIYAHAAPLFSRWVLGKRPFSQTLFDLHMWNWIPETFCARQLRPWQCARRSRSPPTRQGRVYRARFNMPEHFPPVERQTEWRVIRLPERRNYIHHDALLCCSTNTWQAAPTADLSHWKEYMWRCAVTVFLFFLEKKWGKIPFLRLVDHQRLYTDHGLAGWRGLGFRNADLWCSTWACLWWSATLGLMKRSSKRRRIGTKSRDWRADAQLRRFKIDFLRREIVKTSLF